MFIDSDRNTDVSSYGDENFLNHPGFLGICWSNCEEKRVESTESSVKSDCGVSNPSSLNCQQLDDAYWCLDDKKQSWLGASTSSRGARRVRQRNLSAIDKYLGQVEQFQDSRDCEGSTSGLDSAQQEVVDLKADLEALAAETTANLQNMSLVAQEEMLRQKSEADKKQQMIMIGGGAIIAVLLIGLVMKKKNNSN